MSYTNIENKNLLTKLPRINNKLPSRTGNEIIVLRNITDMPTKFTKLLDFLNPDCAVECEFILFQQD